MDKKIVVEYRTRQDYCHCCEQKLKSPKISEIKEFNLSKENIKDLRSDWEEIAEDGDDLQEIVTAYVYDTIDFFATSWNEKIFIEDCEIDKVKNFILNEVIT